MNKIVIIHGYTSHCDAEWFPWLKTRLERDGLMPYIPEMPDSDHPVLQDWLNQLEREIPVFDEDTLLIGHSLGSITLLRYLLQKKVASYDEKMYGIRTKKSEPKKKINIGDDGYFE